MADEKTYFRIGFDDETTAMLMELSEATHCEPTKLVAALVRDLLVEDALSHGQVHAESPAPIRTH